MEPRRILKTSFGWICSTCRSGWRDCGFRRGAESIERETDHGLTLPAYRVPLYHLYSHESHGTLPIHSRCKNCVVGSSTQTRHKDLATPAVLGNGKQPLSIAEGRAERQRRRTCLNNRGNCSDKRSTSPAGIASGGCCYIL